MMKLERKETPKRTVKFCDLPIGEVYRDEDGRVAIKLEDEISNNSFTFGWLDEENTWEVTTENRNADVIPLKATLTVWEED